jgi:thiol-disulfide isomerase/thioredoxin
MTMTEIKTLEAFYQQIEQDKTTVVYFYTRWCPDCFATKIHLPRLIQEYDHYDWVQMDRDADLALAKHLNIYGIPSFLVFRAGTEIGRYVDKQRKTYDQIKAFLDQLDQ